MNITQVKRCLNRQVKFSDNRYKTIFRFRACIFRLGNNGYYYTAELYDEKTNSAVICKLEDIEEVQQSELQQT